MLLRKKIQSKKLQINGWGKFPGHDLFSEDANFDLELLLLLLVLVTAHIVVVKAKFEYSEIL